MKNTFDSMTDGLDIANSNSIGSALSSIDTHIDVKAVRAATHMTQTAFAEAYDLPLGTVRDWEQGLRRPDCGSITLLKMIQADPVAVERFVDKVR
ncbi:hypothetical protein [Sphingomonas panaciterrae]|uniref:helix-turn-helix domain-containing protein n=1 Tax=Sphingomonas panaciterrae TaxID=1462999 RepID=UPI002FF02185